MPLAIPRPPHPALVARPMTSIAGHDHGSTACACASAVPVSGPITTSAHLACCTAVLHARPPAPPWPSGWRPPQTPPPLAPFLEPPPSGQQRARSVRWFTHAHVPLTQYERRLAAATCCVRPANSKQLSSFSNPVPHAPSSCCNTATPKSSGMAANPCCMIMPIDTTHLH